MTTVVRTKLEVTGERKAKQDIDGVNTSLGGMGKAGSAATAGLAAIGGATAVAAAGLAAVAVAIRGVTAAAERLGAVAARGGNFDAVASRFEAMADPQLLGRLQDLSGWQIRQIDIMRSYSQTMEVGLVSAGEYEQWLERITRLAQDRGGDPTAWLERFTQVLSGGGLEILREMGVNVAAVQEELRAQGLSLESNAGKALALDLAMQQLADTQGEVSNEASHLGDVWSQLQAMQEDSLDTQARIIATNPQLVHGFVMLQTELLGSEGAAESLSVGLTNLAISAAEAVAHIARDVVLGIADIAQSLEQGVRAMLASPTVSTFLEAIGQADEARTLANGFEILASQMNSAAESATRVRAAFGDRSELEAGAGPTPGRRGGGRIRGGGGGASGPDAAGLEAEAILHEMRMEAEQDEQRRQATMAAQEAEAEWHQQRKEREDEINETILAHIEEQKIAAAEAAEAAQEESTRRLERQKAEMLGIANATAGAFQTVGNIMQTVIRQQEAAGKSAEGLKKVYGGFLVVYNSVKAATEFAEAIGSFASFNIAGGIAHVASGAAHVAAAVQAASQMGGGTPTAAAAPTSTFVPSTPDQVGTGGGAKQSTTVINQYAIARSEPDLGYAFERAVQARQASRLPDPAVAGVGYEL